MLNLQTSTNHSHKIESVEISRQATISRLTCTSSSNPYRYRIIRVTGAHFLFLYNAYNFKCILLQLWNCWKNGWLEKDQYLSLRAKGVNCFLSTWIRIRILNTGTGTCTNPYLEGINTAQHRPTNAVWACTLWTLNSCPWRPACPTRPPGWASSCPRYLLRHSWGDVARHRGRRGPGSSGRHAGTWPSPPPCTPIDRKGRYWYADIKQGILKFCFISCSVIFCFWQYTVMFALRCNYGSSRINIFMGLYIR